jgi:FkbM family methyltransferase
MKYLKSSIQSALRKRGKEIVPSPIARFLSDLGISVVLDVGGSDGHYGAELRTLGYLGRIVSFEPLPASLQELRIRAKKSPPWEVLPVALGEHSGSATLNVSSNRDSSSFLTLLEQVGKSAPGIFPVGTVDTQIARLDDLYWNLCSPEDKTFLKIDTQGFETAVLEGAKESLRHCTAVQVELSLVPLYAGQSLIEDLIRWLREREFTPIWFSHGFRDMTECRLLQMDGIFTRNNARDTSKQIHSDSAYALAHSRA